MVNEKKLAKVLILDELFDLLLYRELKEHIDGGLSAAFDELIPIEEGHFRFWQEFFGVEGAYRDDAGSLGIGRRLKLRILVAFCRMTGETGTQLVIEAIEVYGVRKYLKVWKLYKDTTLGKAVKNILTDELKHEEDIIERAAGRTAIVPDRVRDIFLGFNDGLVEVVGAVSGFFAAFGTIAAVLVAGFTVAIAGAISMAAGSYVAMSSGREVERTEEAKKRFLGEPAPEEDGVRPFNTAMVVGISYIVGAMVPLVPVLLGSKSILASIIASGAMLAAVSAALAFLSGMNVLHRIALNLAIIAVAVGVTYAIGLFAKTVFGVNL